MVGPTTFLLPSRSNGAPTLVVSGPTEDDVTVAVGLLAALAKVPMIGTASGLRAAQNLRGLPVSGGERIRLSDLGFSSVEFSGRFFRLGIDIAMPPDFLAADYAKLTIDLAGGYAAGLNADAQVRVEVNGRNGANVALPNSSGDVFRHNEIYVPLGMLRPGSNRIEILAQLPNQSDVTCDTAGPVDKDAKRFLLLSSTEIRFPAIARLGRTPDLMLTTAGGFPYTTAASPRLVVPTPDRESLSAAATLAVRLAVAARDLIPFTFTLARPTEATDHTLIVAPAQALDPELMKAIGLDPDAVRRVWENRAVPESAAAPLPPARVVLRHTQTENSAASIEPKPAPSIAGVELSSSAASTEIVDRWSGMVGKRAVWDGFPDVIKSIGRHASNASAAVMSVIRSQGTKAKTPESSAIDARASLIIAQGQRPGSDTGTVTIVTAPDSRVAPAIGGTADGSRAVVQPSRPAVRHGRIRRPRRRGGTNSRPLSGNAAEVLWQRPPDRRRLVFAQPRSLRHLGTAAGGDFGDDDAVPDPKLRPEQQMTRTAKPVRHAPCAGNLVDCGNGAAGIRG